MLVALGVCGSIGAQKDISLRNNSKCAGQPTMIPSFVFYILLTFAACSTVSDSEIEDKGSESNQHDGPTQKGGKPKKPSVNVLKPVFIPCPFTVKQ